MLEEKFMGYVIFSQIVRISNTKLLIFASGVNGIRDISARN